MMSAPVEGNRWGSNRKLYSNERRRVPVRSKEETGRPTPEAAARTAPDLQQLLPRSPSSASAKPTGRHLGRSNKNQAGLGLHAETEATLKGGSSNPEDGNVGSGGSTVAPVASDIVNNRKGGAEETPTDAGLQLDENGIPTFFSSGNDRKDYLQGAYKDDLHIPDSAADYLQNNDIVGMLLSVPAMVANDAMQQYDSAKKGRTVRKPIPYFKSMLSRLASEDGTDGGSRGGSHRRTSFHRDDRSHDTKRGIDSERRRDWSRSRSRDRGNNRNDHSSRRGGVEDRDQHAPTQWDLQQMANSFRATWDAQVSSHGLYPALSTGTHQSPAMACIQPYPPAPHPFGAAGSEGLAPVLPTPPPAQPRGTVVLPEISSLPPTSIPTALETLKVTKRDVKAFLKEYDLRFEQFNGRKPTKKGDKIQVKAWYDYQAAIKAKIKELDQNVPEPITFPPHSTRTPGAPPGYTVTSPAYSPSSPAYYPY